MKNKKLNNIINKILIIFLIIQPIFDLKIFYNSISTLIRVIIIFAMFSYYFFISKNKKKYWLLAYPLLIGIYFIFHHLNALKFKSLVPGNFNYSIVKEILYFAKMLSPFMLIYSLYKSDITKDKIMNIMQYIVLIMGLVIVVSNLFVFSYGSYSDTIIKANFFEWFNTNSPYNYQDLASKGLFEFGNQIAAILIMFLPFTINNSLQKRNFFQFLIVGLNVFTLILLCTKVSVLGIVVVIFYTSFAVAFTTLIQKKNLVFKQYIPIGIIVFMYCILFPFNPMFSRIQERATVIENFNSKIENEINDDIPNNNLDVFENDIQIIETPMPSTPENIVQEDSLSDEMVNYIESNYESKQLHKQFIFENYPYKYDPEFWYNFLQNDISLTTDYRYIELSMIKRVVEINNNKMDKWFGITNTRLQNIFNIERDFVVQYYALGIIGTILVFAPYFVLLGILAYTTLKNKFKILDNVTLLSAITIIFLFAISYFTGNLLNSLSFTIYFTLCFNLIQIKKDC